MKAGRRGVPYHEAVVEADDDGVGEGDGGELECNTQVLILDS